MITVKFDWDSVLLIFTDNSFEGRTGSGIILDFSGFFGIFFFSKKRTKFFEDNDKEVNDQFKENEIFHFILFF